MAVISMMRMNGDPDELVAKIDEHVRPVGRRLAPRHGGLGNIVAKTSDGVIAINLWKSEEGRHAMAAEPEMQEAVRLAGLPQPHFEAFEIAHYTILPEALEGSS
jgi:hypothetical protein